MLVLEIQLDDFLLNNESENTKKNVNSFIVHIWEIKLYFTMLWR